MSFNITVEGGSSVRLPTAGKYCDQDIVITATGGGSGGGSGSGGSTQEDALIEGTLTECTNDRVENIRGYAFYYMATLEKVSFPNVLEVMECAFERSGIISANMPKLKTVGERAFYMSELKTITLPKAETLGRHAFAYAESLESVSFPEAISVANSCFADCLKLKSIYLPKATKIEAYAFKKSSIEHIELPSITSYLNYQTFDRCSALKTVILGSPSKIETEVFVGCSVLSTVVIRKSDGIVALANVLAFKNTPFAEGGTGGTVYVPSALIEQYQAATNWSSLYAAGTCNFVAIEGSEYE